MSTRGHSRKRDREHSSPGTPSRRSSRQKGRSRDTDEESRKKRRPGNAKREASSSVDYKKQLDKTEKSSNLSRELQSQPRSRRPSPHSGRPVSEAASKAVDEFVRELMQLGVFGLRKEFGDFKKGIPEDETVEAFASNPTRNKFKDLVCIDSTRVVLTLGCPPETDYIHASWVTMTGVDRPYIATQIPFENTIEDFWRMCYQESVKTIIVLCNFFEKGSVVFKRYWPESDEIGEYGNFAIEIKAETQEERITSFTLAVTYNSDSDHTLTLTLIQITDWYGKTLIECGISILRVLKRIDRSGHCVVQCTNGVGRTGVVIAVDVISTRLFKGETVKMKDVVQELRTMRACSFQSANHYILLASTVLSYIKAKIPLKYQKQANAFRAEITPSAN